MVHQNVIPKYSRLGNPESAEINTNVKDNYCPVFFGHGTIDPVVPMHWGEKSADLIKSKGMDVQFKKYRGLQHSSHPDEFGDIKLFLDAHLKKE